VTTSPRLVYTPSPDAECCSFNAGTEVIYADFTDTPVIYDIAWVCEPGWGGAVLVSVADLSVSA